MSFNSVNDKMDQAQQDASEDNYVLATVTDNNDPLGLNRIKVSAKGLFDPEQGEQPWIGAHAYSPFGQGSDFGVYGAPALGSKVKVKLQDGDVNQAQYEASAYVKADANPKFASPKTWGYKDPSGNELFVNMETQDWQFTHSSGDVVNYTAAGDLTTLTKGARNEQVDGVMNVVINGRASITSKTRCDIQAPMVTINSIPVDN